MELVGGGSVINGAYPYSFLPFGLGGAVNRQEKEEDSVNQSITRAVHGFGRVF